MKQNPSTTSERQLLFEILLDLERREFFGRPVPQTTKALIDEVLEDYPATPEDLEELPSGGTRIRRRVRNALVSHRTLEKQNLITKETQGGREYWHLAPAGVRLIAGTMLDIMQSQPTGLTPITTSDRPLTETQLMTQSMFEMANSERAGRSGMTIGQIVAAAVDSAALSPLDLELLPSGDIRVKRLVRNIYSHQRIIRDGYAEAMPPENGDTHTRFSLTDKGWDFVMRGTMKTLYALCEDENAVEIRADDLFPRDEAPSIAP